MGPESGLVESALFTKGELPSWPQSVLNTINAIAVILVPDQIFSGLSTMTFPTYRISNATGGGMQDHRPKVLIAEDHTLLAELCKKLLDAEFNVVGIAHNGRDLVRSSADLRPDMVVVDISMPILNGLDAGQRVREMFPNVKLVYLTMDPSEEVAAEAMLRGASGYVVKTCAASELLIAVRSVMRGKSYMCSAISTDSVHALAWRRGREVKQQHNLSPRQREVLQLIAEGRLMKEVAEILSITVRTATFHKYRIMETVGAHSHAELVRYAIKNHLVSA